MYTLSCMNKRTGTDFTVPCDVIYSGAHYGITLITIGCVQQLFIVEVIAIQSSQQDGRSAPKPPPTRFEIKAYSISLHYSNQPAPPLIWPIL